MRSYFDLFALHNRNIANSRCVQFSFTCVIPRYRGGNHYRIQHLKQKRTRENACRPITIGFYLTPDWLKGLYRRSDWLNVTWFTRVFPRLVRAATFKLEFLLSHCVVYNRNN